MVPQDNVIVGALEKCTTRESIEDIFNKFQVIEKAERIDKLNETMGNPQTFFSSDGISIAEKYELTIEMFLSMSWKLARLYERMGVGVYDPV